MTVYHELPTNSSTVIVEDTSKPGWNHPGRFVVSSILWSTMTVTWKVNSDYTLEFEAADDSSDGFKALQQGHLLYAVGEDWIVAQVEDTSEAGYAHTVSVKCTQIASEFSRFYYRKNAYTATMAHTWTPHQIARTFFNDEVLAKGNDWFTDYHLMYNVYGNFDARPVKIDTGSLTNVIDTIRKTWTDCVVFPTRRSLGIYTRDSFYKDRGHQLGYMNNVSNVHISIDKTTIVNRVRAVGPGISDDDLDSPARDPYSSVDWVEKDLEKYFFGNIVNAGLTLNQVSYFRDKLHWWDTYISGESESEMESPDGGIDEGGTDNIKSAYTAMKDGADKIAAWLTKLQGNATQTYSDVMESLKTVLSDDMEIAGKIESFWEGTSWDARRRVLINANKNGGNYPWMQYYNAKHTAMFDEQKGVQTNDINFGYLYYKPFLVWNQASIDRYGIYDGPDVTSDTITSAEAMKVKAESTLKPNPTMSLTCTMMSNTKPIAGDMVHFYNHLTGYNDVLPIVGYVWKPFVLDDNTQLTLNTVEKDMLDYSNSVNNRQYKHTTYNISSGIEEIPWTEDAVNDFLDTIQDPTMQEGVPDEDK